ncbi:type II secretion system F family protein [Plesiomonas shigelloides]|uniref:Type 4 fimbrial assembly protein PilC n=2 Tax=Plesiomonas shigelloides TaxID=703 RepID=R8AT61_PLESH|nr:type II secretion system F family protein [Plesiomonas shigelloides]EON89511.1 type 4 fimbrial assembly protein PilC [Plesiomonas shigelloides 302-73]KAB7663512.1 type II secretion system F family protein [Plesiomonas shigelloides]KAB7701826.1 type II secretion system F family protein [Plesiomonas shigelloides]MBO1108042.1 type II secretion system F family protein [Plesiomonas shigelloides]QIY09326.1 type II secretion system F family protein [Plesiomonas shigelloides]
MSALTQPKVRKQYAYKWKAVNRQGQETSGELDASSLDELKVILMSRGFSRIEAKKVSQSVFAKLKDRIKPSDIAFFSRQLSTMLFAGVPVLQALRLIGESHAKPSMRRLINGIAADVESGTPISQSLRKYPLIFDDLFCDLVSTGEVTGRLDLVMDRIATHREKMEALKSKIKKALFYPSMVMLVAIGVSVLMLLFVIPQFEQLYHGFGSELPAFTQMVLNLSILLREQGGYVAAGIVLAFYLYRRAYRGSEKVRMKQDAVMLKMPVIGEMLHKASVARFSRTLSVTFSAGVPLLSGLLSASGASGNLVYRNAILAVRKEAEQGIPIHLAMQKQQLFPAITTQMVMIGEESGSLDGMLDKIASIYEQEVDDMVDALSSLLEPFIMVIIGGIVGSLVVAMYLPIFNMGSVIG